MELRDYLLGAITQAPREKPDAALDSAVALDNAACTHMEQSMCLHAASVLNTFAETTDEDLDAGESLADRLLALLVGIVDRDDDQDLDDDEQEQLGIAMEAAERYMVANGVDPEDAADLLDNWTDDAASRVRDALAAGLPEGEAADDAISGFAFDVESTEAVFDAARKNMVVFQNGKKVVKSRRISGPPKRLSPKQRAALRKAQSKSNSSRAKRWRAVSVKKRIKSGIGMKRKYA